MTEVQRSKSNRLAANVIYSALKTLQKAGGEMKGRQVMDMVGLQIDLDDWAKERYEKSGYIRWQSILHFYSIRIIGDRNSP